MSLTTRKLICFKDELHHVAIRKTGLNDFGDPIYRRGLHVLLDAFDTDLQLTAAGWQVAYDTILQSLIARLHTQKGWVEHPEVLATSIHRPLIIVGLPRSGTTALHRLLAVDPQFQGLETWLSRTPMIRPPHETWETHPAYRACVANIDAQNKRLPELRTAHEFVAAEVEECTGVLNASFVNGGWPALFSLPTYGRWLSTQSAREPYQYYANVLRLIGAREPHKRWLLKSPYHMVEIDILLETFPDACVIHTHRDPLKAIPSFCSAAYMFSRDLQGETARPATIGPWQCKYWRNALDRLQAGHQRSPTQFLDIDHRRFLADPLDTVQSIYKHFSLRLLPRTEEQMRARVAVRPTLGHGKHHYDVAAWGVAPAEICDTFSEYRAQYQYT